MTQQPSSTVQQEQEANQFSFTKCKPALIKTIRLLVTISVVSFALIPSFKALAMDCNDCTEYDGGGGGTGSPDTIPDPYSNPVMEPGPATHLDMPDPGESSPAVVDGIPGNTVSGYTLVIPNIDPDSIGSTSSAPDKNNPRKRIWCNGLMCHLVVTGD